MSQGRISPLVAKLEKGIDKTMGIVRGLTPEQWQQVVYDEPYAWTVRDLLAHFLSSEVSLLDLAKDVAAGGAGAPEGFDYDDYNRQEQERLAGRPAQEMLAALAGARRDTVDWVRTLADDDLDIAGRHPALGQVALETMIMAIYGHQLLHMRDLMRALNR